jgi:hypothetical protein
MKIDVGTGSITICEVSIPRDLTLVDFLVNPSYLNRTKVVENPPFATYKFECSCGGLRYIPSLYFRDGALAWVSIYVSDLPASGGRADWSDSEEHRSLKTLVDLLAAQGIANGQCFNWGAVEATYDPRAGASTATVRYI